MTDPLICYGAGCGRPLTWERLSTGLRGPQGILCTYCVAEKVATGAADACGLEGAARADWIARMVAWMVTEEPSL